MVRTKKESWYVSWGSGANSAGSFPEVSATGRCLADNLNVLRGCYPGFDTAGWEDNNRNKWNQRTHQAQLNSSKTNACNAGLTFFRYVPLPESTEKTLLTIRLPISPQTRYKIWLPR
jgi:hypothetical protein